MKKLPQHIAIIMDGNGRWASKRGLPRIAGHKVGAESVRTVIKSCLENEIPILTLFAFSTENWERPKEEVNYLMGHLFIKALEDEIDGLHKNGIQLKVIGDIERLENNLQQKILAAEKLTANNDKLKLVIALSYSGRWDITEAVRKIASKIAANELTVSDINDQVVHDHICLNQKLLQSIYFHLSRN